MADGRVEFEITADGRKAFASIDQVTDALDKAGKEWEKDAGKSTDNIGGSFEGMVKKIAGAISAAKIGQMLLNIGKEAIQAASDLEEVQNVVDVTFGDSGAIKIEKWAKTAGEQFGLTETQAKKFTSTLGAMMKSSGMTGNEIVQMSTDLSGLAADMASFYNLDFDTAFQKIRSGISGETEPLKQLGINMSEVNLEAFAMEQGITKAYSAMSQSEKTVLRYNYLMQATADAQGDFARTSDGFANATRKMETNMESLKTNLGKTLLPVVNDVIGAINNMFDALTQEKKQTVLDDFAAIDLKTEEKIAGINSTAEKARTLTDVLKGIDDQAAASGESLKTMDDEAPDGSSLNGLVETLQGIEEQSGEDKKAIKGIDTDAPDGSTGKIKKLKENIGAIESTAVAAKDAVGAIDENAGAASESITAVATEAGKAEDAVEQVEKGANAAQNAVEELASPTERTAEQNALWLETCKELVNTIPGLSSIINTQTGEIKGGTQAVYDYIDAWERGQKLAVFQSAHQQKQAALDAKFAELPVFELDKTVAEYRAKKSREQLDNLLQKYGLEGYSADTITQYGLGGKWAEEYGLWGEDVEKLDKEIAYYQQLKVEAENAKAAYEEQKAAYDEAVIAFNEEGKIIDETYGNAIETAGQWTDAQKESAKTAVNAFQEALNAVEDYYNAIRKETASDVNGKLKGFDHVKSVAETYKEAMKDADEAQKQLEELKKFFGEGIEINFETAGAHQQIKDMVEGLRSQIDFIEQYQKDLAAAREKGLSEEMLAYLSDGSEQSAAYLNAIANADSTQIEEINKLYEEVNKGKETFIDELTKQKLAVDEQYQGLVESAQQAAKDLDVSDETGTAARKNIHAIAAGINQQIPEVRDQVNAVLKQLNRLAEWGVNIDLNFGGSMFIGKRGSKTESIGEYETGLNWVPFDGFLASLHEGEAVLTAEENRVWQQFKNNQRGVDYDALGGVMRDNVRPGGDVFLDGRVVGQVVSQIQGNQYRTMQRSGWQQ